MKKISLIAITLLCVLGLTTYAIAQGPLPNGGVTGSNNPNTGGVTGTNPPSQTFTIKNPLSCGTIDKCFEKIMDILFTLSIPVASAMVLYGGFLMIAGGVQPKRRQQGRQIIWWTTIGFVVILCSQVLTNVLISLFTQGS